MNILVCDGRSRASLQIIRSIARRGHKVYVGESFFCLSFLSNAISGKLIYSNPDLHSDDFFNDIKSFVRAEKIDFIFPVRDSSTEIFSKRKDEILPCLVGAYNFNKMMVLQRKDNLMKLAEKIGVPYPATYYLKEKNVDFSIIKADLDLPFIAKPILSSGSRGIYLIRNKKEFEFFVHAERSVLSKYIVQEYIPHGGAIGVYSIYAEGNLIALNTHVRIREYPHSGGPSTLRRSGKNALCEHFARKILENVSWNGVSMVEFRVHKEKKIPYLMEINTRFWGSLAVDIHSGIDFPSIALELYMKKRVKNSFYKSKRNVFVRWLFLGDLLWLITHPKKIDALIKFLDFRNQKFDVLDRKDPLPVVGAILEGLISIKQKSRRQHVFSRGWNG